MPNYRERSNGERPDEFRTGQDHVADSGSDMSRGELLVEEPPGLGREDLQLRQEWQLALRIVASKGFCKSDLLQKFLLYVCEQQLMGNTHEITEQRIGTQIFNRTTDYNPGEDNIVRSYARLLRKRLDKYFEGEGLEEPLRVDIPRGGYVPVFLCGSGVQEPVSRLSIHSGVEKTGLGVHSGKAEGALEVAARLRYIVSGARWRPAWLSVFAGLLAGVLLASAGWIGARTVWVFCKILRGTWPDWRSMRTGPIFPMSNRRLGLDLKNLNDLRRQRYTSVVDLNITAMLAQLPESAESQSEIRYARSITTEDLKSSNAILLGSTHTNPWVSLFEKNLNFKLEYMPEVDRSFVLNEHPVGAEQKRYVNGTGTANRTYGAIDYLPSLDGTGHVLIIQGLNMAATQAAADTLFSSEEMKPILKQVVRPDRSVQSFELLVETSSIGATAPGAQIIATRFYP